MPATPETDVMTFAARDGSPDEVPMQADSVAELKATIADVMQKDTGQAPVLEALLAKGYENLPPCLPVETH